MDAVYMPLPTSLHVHFAVMAAQNGKHVLIEKPTALDEGELVRILEACESNGVQFMDGSMWLHHPRTAKIKEMFFDSKLFGDVNYVSFLFWFEQSFKAIFFFFCLIEFLKVSMFNFL